VAIPPIGVYRVGDLHFVKDGHHRVSVAIATGQQMIDADVTQVLTQLPATGISRRSDLMRIARSGKALTPDEPWYRGPRMAGRRGGRPSTGPQGIPRA
jgi:hypothetical protein